MLYIYCLVKNFLELVLAVLFDLFLIAIYKHLKVLKALAEERLKLVTHNQDKAVYVLLPLVLLLMKADPVLEERRSKRNLVTPFCYNNGKVVFILLTEVVLLYVELFAIHI